MEIKDINLHDMFFKENFNVDECLSKYTHKGDLETLRRQLKSYGAELQHQMSDILKTETEAIVNLAENLTNLQIKIDNLQQPISQLREEILSLHTITNNAEHSYGALLGNIKSNNTLQNNIQLKQGILSSSIYIENCLKTSQALTDLLSLEHMVNKFSFQKHYMEILHIITPDIQHIINDIEKKIIEVVNEHFLESFHDKDEDTLIRCLRLYNNMGKRDIAHETFRIHTIKPFLEKALTEKALEKCHDLDVIYDNVLSFIESRISVIHRITEDNLDLGCYNFMLHSFWKEYDRQSRLSLPLITAPGNPELFKKRFTSTFKLLQKIAEKCGDVNLLREDETFQDHLKRFNLPVYFEIEYQKIAGQFETEISVEKEDVYASDNHLSCKLKPTLALYTAVSQCFHEDVYIEQLADQFLKLVLMLLSRYLKWFNQFFQNMSFNNNSSWETFIMDSLYDLSLTAKFLALKTNNVQDLNGTVFHIVSDKMKPVILKIFKANYKCVENTQKQLKDQVIKIKLKGSMDQLQNVGAIPRLYRRTNRSAPKEASHYIVEALQPILTFEQRFMKLEPVQCKDVLEQTVCEMTNQYHTLVQDVLKSVCKTEHSLRRLKNRNANISEESSTSSDTMSDEMKIKEQIKFDVNYFYDKLYPFAKDDVKATMDLMKREV